MIRFRQSLLLAALLACAFIFGACGKKGFSGRSPFDDDKTPDADVKNFKGLIAEAEGIVEIQQGTERWLLSPEDSQRVIEILRTHKEKGQVSGKPEYDIALSINNPKVPGATTIWFNKSGNKFGYGSYQFSVSDAGELKKLAKKK